MSGKVDNTKKGIKLIVAGTRDLMVDSSFVNTAVDLFRINVEQVVSGAAQGVDAAGEDFSTEYLDRDPKLFPADWTKGLRAGPSRNKKMAEYADALLLIWDGQSEGSADMKTQMLGKRKPIYEIIVKVTND